MNDNIKVRRWTFDNKNSKQTITPANKQSMPFGGIDFSIEVVEIETDNPCNLIIVVTAQAQGGHSETPIFIPISGQYATPRRQIYCAA